MITAKRYFSAGNGLGLQFKDAPVRVYCPLAIDRDDVVRVDVQVWNDAVDVFYGSITLRFTEAELEAFTGSGSGEYSQFKNCVEQGGKGLFGGISENSGTTFTIV